MLSEGGTGRVKKPRGVRRGGSKRSRHLSLLLHTAEAGKERGAVPCVVRGHDRPMRPLLEYCIYIRCDRRFVGFTVLFLLHRSKPLVATSRASTRTKGKEQGKPSVASYSFYILLPFSLRYNSSIQQTQIGQRVNGHVQGRLGQPHIPYRGRLGLPAFDQRTQQVQLLLQQRHGRGQAVEKR